MYLYTCENSILLSPACTKWTEPFLSARTKYGNSSAQAPSSTKEPEKENKQNNQPTQQIHLYLWLWNFCNTVTVSTGILSKVRCHSLGKFIVTWNDSLWWQTQIHCCDAKFSQTKRLTRKKKLGLVGCYLFLIILTGRFWQLSSKIHLMSEAGWVQLHFAIIISITITLHLMSITITITFVNYNYFLFLAHYNTQPV